MKLPVRVRPEAEREFVAAFDWYESQRPGLGVRFAEAVQGVFNLIGDFPEAHEVVHGKDFRRAIIPRFPYVIHYRVLSDHVAVLAVVHGKRDRSSWQ